MTAPSFQVELSATYDQNLLALEWRALEAEADSSFFLSWTWIFTWLESLVTPPLLVRVRSGGDIVALAFLVPAEIRRHVIVHSRQIHVNQSGDPDLDRIATEFNGFLMRRGCEAEILPAVMAYLLTLIPGWDECVFPGVTGQYLSAAKTLGCPCAVDRRSPNFLVDLDALRRTGTDIADTLSRNARGQLRRALNLARQAGPLTIEAAPDPAGALAFFEELKRLDRWRAIGLAGAFATASRDLFHRRLIARGWANGTVELLRVRAGERVTGYLYQFCHRGKVLSYQAAYPPMDDNRLRPGIVMHYMAIGRAISRGFDWYDFLAGEARYKKSLGRKGEELVWFRMQKNRLAFRAERMIGRIRGAMRASLLP